MTDGVTCYFGMSRGQKIWDLGLRKPALREIFLCRSQHTEPFRCLLLWWGPAVTYQSSASQGPVPKPEVSLAGATAWSKLVEAMRVLTPVLFLAEQM